MLAKMVHFLFKKLKHILFYHSKDCTDFVQIETNWIGSFSLALVLPNDKNNVRTWKESIFKTYLSSGGAQGTSKRVVPLKTQH